MARPRAELALINLTGEEIYGHLSH
ncbi:uncharacterized protein G2W53_003574 [Senna tora]|uniref:Uncharacterized protein n=1 Tax=Senna tora TaxID=362788 RepID=A0A835CH52_9FABA|nr:uncharacterized protein G2W53_003574 [Senna tora]